MFQTLFKCFLFHFQVCSFKNIVECEIFKLFVSKITNIFNDFLSKRLDYDEEIDEGGLDENDDDDDGIFKVEIIDDPIK